MAKACLRGWIKHKPCKDAWSRARDSALLDLLAAEEVAAFEERCASVVASMAGGLGGDGVGRRMRLLVEQLERADLVRRMDKRGLAKARRAADPDLAIKIYEALGKAGILAPVTADVDG